MSGRRHGSRGSRPRRGYYWDGLQFGSTAITTSGASFELINPTAQEFMPGTLVRIRGNLTLQNAGSDKVNGNVSVGLKIMYLEVNDAGTITGDSAGIDTHEEDIARRQLWTHHALLGSSGSTSNWATQFLPVDIKAKVKLESSGKMILALLADASQTNRAVIAGYLRCLIMHA